MRVRLRGRAMHGLVVAEREWGADEPPELQPVEALLQRAAVDPDWYSWLEGVADRCHLSAFRTLKAALPAGWIGQAGQRSLAGGRQMWWVQGCDPLDDVGQPSPRQRELLAWLKAQGGGGWQRDLVASGFGAHLLPPLVQQGYLVRERRRAEDKVAAGADLREHPQALTAEQHAVVDAYQQLAAGRGLLGCVAALALSLGQAAQAQETLRFTTSVPAPSFIYADILSVWAQRVIDDSKGSLDIQMFPAGTLGRDPAAHDCVCSGRRGGAPGLQSPAKLSLDWSWRRH